MTWLGPVVVALVVCQRLAELIIGNRNTARLLAEGAKEVGQAHYWLFALLHGAWLASVTVVALSGAPVHIPALAAYCLVEIGRAWVMTNLGRYWTTRIITLPGAPLVASGPYRFCRHPNYVVVAAEILILPLVFGAWELSLFFSILNLPLTWHRIRVEDNALAERRALAARCG